MAKRTASDGSSGSVRAMFLAPPSKFFQDVSAGEDGRSLAPLFLSYSSTMPDRIQTEQEQYEATFGELQEIQQRVGVKKCV